MKCEESQTLLHGYVDGELDLVRSLEIEQHLQECSICAEAHKHLQALRQKIQSAGLYARAPLELHERIRASLHQESQAVRMSEAGQADRAVKSGLIFQKLPWQWFSIAASLAIIARNWMEHLPCVDAIFTRKYAGSRSPFQPRKIADGQPSYGCRVLRSAYGEALV